MNRLKEKNQATGVDDVECHAHARKKKSCVFFFLVPQGLEDDDDAMNTAQLHDEKKRLYFLLEKKKRQLREVKEQESQLLRHIVSFQDQLAKIDKTLEEARWVQAMKKEEKQNKKRALLCNAVESRRASTKGK